MPNFTVRVELHGADETDYENLHEAMERKGFVRWIESNGGRYRLPTAEYNLLDAGMDKAKVLEIAKSTASSVKRSPSPWVLVTESAGRTWSDLERL